jgi:DNA-binding NarL/FixJ family response regulator
VVIGEDDVLLREGIARLLTESGFDVVAQAGDAQDLLRKGLAHRPAVVIADVNMPPGHGDDGLRAAIELRRQRPETGVLVLSQFYEEQYALDLIGDRAEGVGYLLKERVGDVASFIAAVTRVARGGSALDPEVVGRMLGRRQRDRPWDRLSPRERDVLAAMAEGKSNHGIAQALVISQAAVEKHVTSIFHKLELDPAQQPASPGSSSRRSPLRVDHVLRSPELVNQLECRLGGTAISESRFDTGKLGLDGRP